MDIIKDLMKGIRNPIIYGRVTTVDEINYTMEVDVGAGRNVKTSINAFQSTFSGIRAIPLENSIVLLIYDAMGNYIHIGSIYPSHRTLIDETKKFRFNPVKKGEVEVRGSGGNYAYFQGNGDINIYSLFDLQMNLRTQQKILELLTRNINIDNDFLQFRLGEAYRYSTADQVMLPVQDIKTSTKYQQPAIPELNLIFGKRVKLTTPAANPDTTVSPLCTFKLANPIMDDNGITPKLSPKNNELIAELKLYDQTILTQETASIQLDSKGSLFTIFNENGTLGNKFDINSDGIKVTDINNNIIKLDTAGIEITDLNNNVVKLDTTGITIYNVGAQPAARNGDSITLPIGAIITATATGNVPGPVVLTLTAPTNGTITSGSSKVKIG